MSKAGERALLQYLGAITSVLVGILGTKTNNVVSVEKQLEQILGILEDYEKSSKEM